VSVPVEIAVNRAGLSTAAFDAEDVRLVSMPWMVRLVLGRRVSAMTLNRTIFVHPSIFERVVSGAERSLLVHELIHVAQWRDQGIVGFPVRYLFEYVRLRLLGAGHDAAYRGISFEYAAFDAAQRSQGRAA